MRLFLYLLASLPLFSFLYYCVSYYILSLYQESTFLSSESLFFLTGADVDAESIVGFFTNNWHYIYYLEILISWISLLPLLLLGWLLFKRYSNFVVSISTILYIFILTAISQLSDFFAIKIILSGKDVYSFSESILGTFLLKPDIIFVNYFDLVLFIVGAGVFGFLYRNYSHDSN